jgi:hypothetical protein
LTETFLFTATLIVLLFSLASFPSRFLGYPVSDVLAWYNDFYLLIPAVPVAAIVGVEVARRIPSCNG